MSKTLCISDKTGSNCQKLNKNKKEKSRNNSRTSSESGNFPESGGQNSGQLRFWPKTDQIVRFLIPNQSSVHKQSNYDQN